MTNFFDPTLAQVGDPVTIVRGRHVAWRRLLDVDSALYSVKYVFQSRETTATTYTVTGTRSGDYWAFELLGTVSANWVEGEYAFDVVVVRTSDSEQAVINTGNTSVFKTSTDRRGHAEIMVEKIESILQNRAASDVDSYTIGSRSISKMSVMELTKWREYYRSEMGEGASGTRRNKVKVGFV